MRHDTTVTLGASMNTHTHTHTRILLQAGVSVFVLLACAIDARAQTARRMSCELSDIQSLAGWSQAAQQYWKEQIANAVGERVSFFLDQGRFEPRVYQLNGNIAALSSGTFHRERVDTAISDSDKVKVGTVPGTEVPVYEIKSDRNSSTVELVTVREGSYRLPVRARDLPAGSRETVLFSARCEVGGNGAIARAVLPRRVERAATAPALPKPVAAKKAEGGLFGN
jgi:hypothetical protein